MSRPVIAITCDHDRSRERYELSYAMVAAVASAGGEPVMLPFHRNGTLPDWVEGCVFSGGNDPDPAAWGETWHPTCNPVDPEREAHERRLVEEAQRRDLPALGVCFGMQVMNLIRGGTLIQHLGDDAARADHTRGDAGWRKRHLVACTAGSRLAQLTGRAGFEVNTSHHQAVGRVGDGLQASAHAPDGVVEAIEDPGRAFWIGVQWHPERQPDDPVQRSLFGALVASANVPRGTFAEHEGGRGS
jgi:putative glutamine amidotransferase